MQLAKDEATECLDNAARDILAACGIWEDGSSYKPPFEDTPRRFADAILELTRGHREEPPDLRTFEYTGAPQLISSVHNQAYCLCPHHLLAVELSCSVAYVAHGQSLPGEIQFIDTVPTGHTKAPTAKTTSGKILGLSKIPRLIHWAAARLTTQEELAQLLATLVQESTLSQAVFIHIEGTHSCMRARGIKTNGSVTTFLSLGARAGQWTQMFMETLR